MSEPIELTQVEYNLLCHPFLIDATIEHLAERLIAMKWIERATDRYVATNKGREVIRYPSNAYQYERVENNQWDGCELSNLVFPDTVHAIIRTRVRYALRLYDIRTVDELRRIGRDEITHWPNFGNKSVRVLADVTNAFDKLPPFRARTANKADQSMDVEDAVRPNRELRDAMQHAMDTFNELVVTARRAGFSIELQQRDDLLTMRGTMPCMVWDGTDYSEVHGLAKFACGPFVRSGGTFGALILALKDHQTSDRTSPAITESRPELADGVRALKQISEEDREQTRTEQTGVEAHPQ